MKILVVGADGQLAKAIRSLVDSGSEVKRMESCIAAIDDWTFFSRFELDITNEASTMKTIEDGAYDAIINCAAYTNVDACEDNAELAFAVNSEGPKNLAKAATNIDAKLIHVSTDYVFSGDANSPYVETDECAPRCVYGLSKLSGEYGVLENCRRSFIVRSSWLYGHTEKNFVKAILRKASTEHSIRVVSDQIGNPTYANDLAEALLRILESEEYGIYHCTNRGFCSWFEFASAIVSEAGLSCEKTPCLTKDIRQRAPRPHFSSLDCSKYFNTFGISMRSWQDALASFFSRERELNKNDVNARLYLERKAEGHDD